MFGNESVNLLQPAQSPTLHADINYLKMDESEFHNSCFKHISNISDEVHPQLKVAQLDC